MYESVQDPLNPHPYQTGSERSVANAEQDIDITQINQ